MRYRSKNSPEDFSRDVATFVALLGEDNYRGLLYKIYKALNHKGYVTPTDDLRFSLELQLLNLERLRENVGGQFAGAPEHLHEAADFAIGLGQTIPYLSAQAQKKLRGQIVSGLKKNGLRPVQHEMRVAGLLSKIGCDVTFADLEGEARYDFLAAKDGITYEVEAKSLSIFSGQAILPQDVDKFFLALQQKFERWNDPALIPVFDVVVKNHLPPARILELVEGLNTVGATRQSVALDSGVAIKFVGTVADAPYRKLAYAARLDELRNWIRVYVSPRQPKIIVRLLSESSKSFAQNAIDAISYAAKKQFSGKNPGIIWTHVDCATPAAFDYLAYADKGNSLFDLMARVVFDSPRRNHTTQLIFSGGANLIKKDDYQTSSFRRVIYNSPCTKFAETALFPEGRQLKAGQTLRGSVAKAILDKTTFKVVEPFRIMS